MAGSGRSRTAATVAAVVVLVLGLAGCTGGWSPGGGADGAAGAGGLGDPYFPSHGNAGYQVDHYRLQVGYDPASKQLTGTTTIEATATADLSGFSLDLSGLTVRSVTVEGVPASFERGDEKLVVTPAEPVPDGAGFTAVVGYDGSPEPVNSRSLGSNGFQHSDEGAFAIGQPRSASTWFPVNDHPLDKATYAIEATVPDGLAALSNGVPEGRSAGPAGSTTWRWSEGTEMASYLTTLVIGDYRVHESEHRGKPMVTAVHADLPVQVDRQLAASGLVADVLEEWFGPYPFDAYGGIALADQRVGFALETQSRPVYGPSFFADGRDATGVIVHELAHQWFGNSVSVRGWNELWLNEGFATYAEWLYEERDGGDTAQETFDLYWDGPGGDDEFWSPATGDPGPRELFSHAVYVRGAMALHALRRTVGDDGFFQILREWATQMAGGNVGSADLLALSEQVSGRELGELFDQWLYRTDRPPYPGAAG
ncbi:MAG: M1 family metallopeptidase [Natronosporangium sp.]